ncbi:unnamed protein product [Mytilus coruscus]|uniref:Integrase catalytic domain-containing protein n=1 Tax=Mytilus coruscus TaxID=42192 RepID=A0A6J8A9G3_MYTCO|nr:unnamed protein product [Mytilus coruscus]
MPDMRAETVADILFRAWVKRYGCPVEIHSDQGRQYESAVFRELCQLLEINKTRTTPLHPRSAGMIERMTVNDILSKYIKKHQKDWDEHLDYTVMAYNATPHESTGITPHRIIYGIKLKIARHWTGPWVITEKLSDITFKVKCAKNSPEVTVHGDILKPYLGSKKMVWFNQQNARPDMPEQHPVEFPDLAEFTADVDDESSSVSENLPGIIGGK